MISDMTTEEMEDRLAELESEILTTLLRGNQTALSKSKDNDAELLRQYHAEQAEQLSRDGFSSDALIYRLPPDARAAYENARALHAAKAKQL